MSDGISVAWKTVPRHWDLANAARRSDDDVARLPSRVDWPHSDSPRMHRLCPCRLDLAFPQFPFIHVGLRNPIAWLAASTWQQPHNDNRPSGHVDRRGCNYLPNLEAMIRHGPLIQSGSGASIPSPTLACRSMGAASVSRLSASSSSWVRNSPGRISLASRRNRAALALGEAASKLSGTGTNTFG